MNDRGIGLIELLVIIVMVIFITFLLSGRVWAADQEGQEMYLTCYCPESCPGTVTATGARVREGIIASSREHLGDGAMIYLTDGSFLGFYECLDTGGTDGIKAGRVIDMYMDSLDRAKEIMRISQGRCLVIWIEDPQG